MALESMNVRVETAIRQTLCRIDGLKKTAAGGCGPPKNRMDGAF